MAPNIGTMYGVPENTFRRMLQVATLEARDPTRGAMPGTVASMINRYHNPDYGSNTSWINPNQYAAMKAPGFNEVNPAKALGYYGSDKGRQELGRVGQELGGKTDFRSTSYLKDIGQLMSHSDNLIPATVGGQLHYYTPSQFKTQKAVLNLSENTFFNEGKRAPTKKWWESSLGAPPGAKVSTIPAQAPTALETLIGAGNLFGQNAVSSVKDLMQEEVLKNLLQQQQAPDLATSLVSSMLFNSPNVS
jgi:hypothetical protein